MTDVSRETEELLGRFEQSVRSENDRQNLVSASTLDAFWERHIRDSLQLRKWIEPRRSVIDIGSGAGLPGVVLACAGVAPMTLVEPRRLRAEFLERVVAELGLPATVLRSRAEAVRGQFDVITGRAVAAVDRFLAVTAHLAHGGTQWILPKGRNAQSELEQARRSWQCEVREEASCTDPDSTILLISKVKRRR